MRRLTAVVVLVLIGVVQAFAFKPIDHKSGNKLRGTCDICLYWWDEDPTTSEAAFGYLELKTADVFLYMFGYNAETGVVTEYMDLNKTTSREDTFLQEIADVMEELIQENHLLVDWDTGEYFDSFDVLKTHDCFQFYYYGTYFRINKGLEDNTYTAYLWQWRK